MDNIRWTKNIAHHLIKEMRIEFEDESTTSTKICENCGLKYIFDTAYLDPKNEMAKLEKSLLGIPPNVPDNWCFKCSISCKEEKYGWERLVGLKEERK